MIEFYEGKIGGGKTYSAVLRILKYLANGGVVATNINLNVEQIRKLLDHDYGYELNEKQIIQLSEDNVLLFHRYTPQGTKELPTLVIIDEAHLFFNAREWNKADKELLTFITQSRKCFTDIIFITQSLKTVDKQLRIQALFVWHFKDLQGLVLPILNFIKYPLPQILQIQFSNDSQLQAPLKRRFVWKRKALFKCYNSFELLREFPRLEQKEKIEKGKTKISTKDKKLAVAGLLILSFILAPKVWGVFTSYKERLHIEKKKVRAVYKENSIRARYTVVRETFIAFLKVDRKSVIITEKNEYWKGYYCEYGLVKDVNRNRVKIQKPDGSYLLLIDDKKPYMKEGENVINSNRNSARETS